MVNEIRSKRRQPYKPVEFSAVNEKFYNGRLRLLINEMARSVDESVVSVLINHYVADSLLTDLLQAEINNISTIFTNRFLNQPAVMLARDVVSRAESESSQAFVQQINRSIGIDMSKMINDESLRDYLDVAIENNVGLITSLSDDYFNDIRREILDGVMRGDSLTTIRKRIQNATGASYKRAELIAVDQMSKIRSDITSKRQTEAGINRFRWSTSKDVRVSGNPVGRYPNAKIKCFEISRKDIGYGKGVYLWSQGASYGGENGLYPGRAHIRCRCTAIPQIKGLDY